MKSAALCVYKKPHPGVSLHSPLIPTGLRVGKHHEVASAPEFGGALSVPDDKVSIGGTHLLGLLNLSFYTAMCDYQEEHLACSHLLINSPFLNRKQLGTTRSFLW